MSQASSSLADCVLLFLLLRLCDGLKIHHAVPSRALNLHPQGGTSLTPWSAQPLSPTHQERQDHQPTTSKYEVSSVCATLEHASCLLPLLSSAFGRLKNVVQDRPRPTVNEPKRETNRRAQHRTALVPAHTRVIHLTSPPSTSHPAVVRRNAVVVTVPRKEQQRIHRPCRAAALRYPLTLRVRPPREQSAAAECSTGTPTTRSYTAERASHTV